MRARLRAVPGINPLKILRGRPVHAPVRAGLPLVYEEQDPFVSQEAVSAIRMKAELARRLSGATSDPAAKAGLLELAALLDADADRLEDAARELPRADPGNE